LSTGDLGQANNCWHGTIISNNLTKQEKEIALHKSECKSENRMIDDEAKQKA
jgi:hypothetical protein